MMMKMYFLAASAAVILVILMWALSPSVSPVFDKRRPCEVVLAEEPMKASDLGQILRCMRDDIKALKAK